MKWNDGAGYGVDGCEMRCLQGTAYQPSLQALASLRGTGHKPPLFAGPLLERAVAVVFEGVPIHPTPSRCWEVVDKYKVCHGSTGWL